MYVRLQHIQTSAILNSIHNLGYVSFQWNVITLKFFARSWIANTINGMQPTNERRLRDDKNSHTEQ